MVLLQHEHSLSFVDLNPKYPHNEEVYDDEEDLITKQAFRCPCDRCDEEITYLHRYYYKCEQCDYSLHKLCAELPTTLEHTSHNAHTLGLVRDELLGCCYTCKSINRYKVHYQCSQCIFIICLECGMNGVQFHTIYHPSHQHPLIPIYKEIWAKCDACGKKHNGVFYMCITCFRSFIHKDCVFKPKRLLIQDATRNNFSHFHPLILAYSFSKADQQAKFNPSCRVCDDSFSENENWVFKCDKCRYYVHLACVNLRHTPSEPGHTYDSSALESTLTSIRYHYENDPSLLHLPLSDRTYSIIKDFIFKETNKMTLTHDGHDHPLILVDTQHNDITTPMHKVEDLCDGCLRSVMDMPFYKCIYGCNFLLHEWCTRLPNELKGHLIYPEHTLFLLPKISNNFLGVYNCHVCKSPCNGFAYICSRCFYVVDIWCALVPEKITHKSHPDHLLSRVQNRYSWRKDYCRMCLSGFTYPSEISFSCTKCNFHLHPECALLLPETITHKYDKHPMALRYLPIENHEGDYFCEVCEEELNPNGCFYHCYDCIQSIHTACAPLVPQSKAFVYGLSVVEARFPNVKFGGIHKTKHHPHPLSFLKGALDLAECTKCGTYLWNRMILKCLECEYKVHKECCH